MIKKRIKSILRTDSTNKIFARNCIVKEINTNDYKQFVIKNILRVHNRRHPRKRLYIDNENNPRGFCGKGDKGDWWSILQTMSKQNLATLRRQSTIYTMQDVFNEIERNNNENAN